MNESEKADAAPRTLGRVCEPYGAAFPAGIGRLVRRWRAWPMVCLWTVTVFGGSCAADGGLADMTVENQTSINGASRATSVEPLSAAERAEIARRSRGLPYYIERRVTDSVEHHALDFAGGLDYIQSCWTIIDLMPQLLRTHLGDCVGVCEGRTCISGGFDEIRRQLTTPGRMYVATRIGWPVGF